MPASLSLSRLGHTLAQLLALKIDALLARVARFFGSVFAGLGSRTIPVVEPADMKETKTVVVLGCAYGGARAAQILAAGLPTGWRLVVLDRNSHANHVYVMPRFAVLPGHEYKAFIPYTNVFLQNSAAAGAAAGDEKNTNTGTEEQEDGKETPRCTVLHAQITTLRAHSVSYRLLSSVPGRSNAGSEDNSTEDADSEATLTFDFAIYALGAHMPPPLDLWASGSQNEDGDGDGYHGRKDEGCAFLARKQAAVARAVDTGAGGGSVLVVGGGALGIQFATDIKAVHPAAAVTLLHSRARLLPRFGEGMHEEILRSCDAMGIEVVLGERLDLGSLSTQAETEMEKEGDGKGSGEVKARRVVRTVSGREIVADLVLMCTGQTPNTALLAGLDEALVEPRSRHVRVHRTLQVADRTVYKEEEEERGAGGVRVAEALAGLALGGAAADTDTRGAHDAESTQNEKEATDGEEATNGKEGTTQTDTSPSPYPHIFAIGDAAAAFGAIPAGHNAYAQGEVAARNVLRLIQRAEARAQVRESGEARAQAAEGGDEKRVGGDEVNDEPLEEYTPGPPAIKVSLGLERAVYQVGASIGVKTDGVPDLQAAAIWPYFGIKVERDEDMRA